MSSVTSYDTIDGRSHECVGKARLQRNPKAPSQAPTDPSIATTTDPQWQRYQRCLDERRGSEAGQRACGILAPVNVTSDADLALRCRGVSELRVLPALTVRTLRIDPPASMGTGAAVILILGGLLLVGAAAGAAELSQL